MGAEAWQPAADSHDHVGSSGEQGDLSAMSRQATGQHGGWKLSHQHSLNTLSRGLRQMTKPSPSQDLLRLLFDFDEATGPLLWRLRPDRPKDWNTKYAGTVAGTVHPRGYRYVKIGGYRHPVHRLVWTYAYGPVPEGMMIDHVNLDRDDNRLANLRLATDAQNRANSGVRANNSVGLKGVYFDRQTQRYRAQIRIGGKARHIGTFDTPEVAHAAYMEVARQEHGEFARA
jgi:hypothetical protein